MISFENAIYDGSGNPLFRMVGPDAANLKPQCTRCGRLPGETCNGGGSVTRNGGCNRVQRQFEKVRKEATSIDALVVETAPIAAPIEVAPAEILPPVKAPAAMSKASAKTMGFTGGECLSCHGFQVVKNGTCDLCLECGSTTGCS